MKFKAFVYVTLKKGYSDPEGDTTANALQGLGYPVEQVRASKAYEVYYEARLRSFSTRCAEGFSLTRPKTITTLR